MSGRALIAAVGQPWMRDLAFGSHVVNYLQTQALPEDVDARDLSFSPLAALEIIEDAAYSAVVFITATQEGRRRGDIFEKPVVLPSISSEELHARIGDCVMGCVSLESLLILCDARGVLPRGAAIIDIEPEDDGWGPELSEAVEPLVVPVAQRALDCIAAFQRRRVAADQ